VRRETNRQIVVLTQLCRLDVELFGYRLEDWDDVFVGAEGCFAVI
jgi:hypothetical protein